VDFATYRIAVGRKHRVEPRQIVGALANEGGLSREHFGRIDIRPSFSLVELPADLSRDTLDRLRDTRIGGVPIELRADQRAGRAPASRPGAGGSARTDRSDRPARKPRQKRKPTQRP
jgi:ATP-dependent RNA helicase DeaD